MRPTYLAAALLTLTTLARAQETRGAAPVVAERRSDLAQACPARDGLSLCVPPAGPRDKPRASPKTRASSLTRFTQLAGAFMGRVDAADIGPLRVRFKLEIR